MNFFQRLANIGKRPDLGLKGSWATPEPKPQRGGFNPLHEIGKRVGQSLVQRHQNRQGFFQRFRQPVHVQSGTFDREKRVFGDVSGADPLPQQTATPAPQATQQAAQPAPQATPQALTPEQRAEIIRRGYSHWGDLPAAQWADTFAQAPDIAEIYQKYPYLPAAIALLESSGGKNITYENNPVNWGIRVEGFRPQSPEEAITKMMTGVGYRMAPYEKFRETQDLADFAYTYAPDVENDTAYYLQKLIEVMEVFQQAEEAYRRELYGG